MSFDEDGVAVAPMLRLDHLRRLTDERGIIQFARFDKPDRGSGYCVDDVSRLAIVAARFLRLGWATETVGTWIATSIDFLERSFGETAGLLRNVADSDGEWTDEPHAGDHVGRALWALGELYAAPVSGTVRHRAAALRGRLRPGVHQLSLRATAYAALGLCESGPLCATAYYLDARLRRSVAPNWYWFEPMLAYDNARLPQALLAAAGRLREPGMTHRALSALDWYCRQVHIDTGPLRCVGNTWRRRDTARLGHEGDEQPIDAAALVECLVDAYVHTSSPRYARLALRCFGWFLGDNAHGLSLYDASTGGCRDGVGRHGVNENQGAESTLAYYQALSRLVEARLVTLSH
ncbi:hypothetical protein [Stackebrandtia nassauensis]|uniref:Mannosyltransferase n=1 Tax=Stackebrandtia nassauensis (strain DSM 44728 / CIP 108903 / NRRL B-16338 / NBRC 102104 / LLR-40K-21) TaxID=446470 RepID=D3PVJ0_STANL|nr:hypothetical protein [Stackebrandtia nassauensis]ADD43104.1 mannosyltransferase [Stackebrandtia nassauensis DSM 44728]